METGKLIAVSFLAFAFLTTAEEAVAGNSTQIYNNPFLNKRIEKIIKQAVDKLVNDKIEEFKEDEEAKYENQILQYRLKNLELRKRILELQEEIQQLKLKLLKLSQTKFEESGENGNKNRKVKIKAIKVIGVVNVGNKATLITENGNRLSVGNEIDGLRIIKIDLNNYEVICKDKNGKIYKLKIVLED